MKRIGSIVLPEGGSHDEVLIGIVVHDPVGESPKMATIEATQHTEDGYYDVVWVSSLRGIFYATEWHGDLREAPLTERESISDPRLHHALIASILDHPIHLATSDPVLTQKCKVCNG